MSKLLTAKVDIISIDINSSSLNNKHIGKIKVRVNSTKEERIYNVIPCYNLIDILESYNIDDFEILDTELVTGDYVYDMRVSPILFDEVGQIVCLRFENFLLYELSDDYVLVNNDRNIGYLMEIDELSLLFKKK